MTRLDLEHYCMKKNGVIKSYPFDEKTAVYKVGNKMFALCSDSDEQMRINVKCEPLYALELRSIYVSVNAGYHMSKKHWNTLTCNQEIEDTLIYEWIDDSYTIIVGSLTKKVRENLV